MICEINIHYYQYCRRATFWILHIYIPCRSHWCCFLSSLPWLITAILHLIRVMALLSWKWAKAILLNKIMLCAKILKIFIRMMLFKQTFIVECLNYYWDIWIMLFLRCLLDAVWLDALRSQSTSCTSKHCKIPLLNG